jgi:hypothetical protein
LDELKKRWQGNVQTRKAKTPEGMAAEWKIVEIGMFDYHRVGYDRREIEFLSGGKIGKGSCDAERSWFIEDDQDVPELCIAGNSITCRLRQEGMVWKGRWLAYEKMPIELSPMPCEVKPVGDYGRKPAEILKAEVKKEPVEIKLVEVKKEMVQPKLAETRLVEPEPAVAKPIGKPKRLVINLEA